MRVSKEQAARNRERILEAAAALIRERGITGVGVDALTDAAGLTHGSLYSQFGSKDRLAAEAVRFALAQTAGGDRAQDLESYVDHYLSAAHCQNRARGCALAALGCEASRASDAVRSAFTDGTRGMVDRVDKLIGGNPDKDREQRSLATVASMVGAVILARAVDDPQLAEQILAASRQFLVDRP